MLKRNLPILLIIGLLLSAALPVWAQDGNNPTAKAVDYILTMQNDDGGFSNGFAPESDIGATADAAVAIVAAGQDPNAVFSGDMMNPFSYLGVQIEEGNVEGAGLLAKVLTAVIAAGKDPTAFGGHNLIDDLLALQDENGVFGSGPFDHCLSLIALQNAGAELPEGAVQALLEAQNEDGGWAFMVEQASDVDTTALCLQALSLTEETEAVDTALAYLQSIQNEDGGWPYQNPSDFGTESSVSSTALVLQSLIATGQNIEDWNNPQDWLTSMQAESGAFNLMASMPGDNFLATVAAVPALAGLPLNAWVPAPAEE